MAVPVAPDATPGRAFYAGILLTSAGVLMQEILLTRIFSFTIWYHLAYLTISTALLGFGAAGSVTSPPAACRAIPPTPLRLGTDGRGVQSGQVRARARSGQVVAAPLPTARAREM